MKKLIKSVFVLVIICAFVAALMAVTNYVTAPIIEKNEQIKANSALLEVMPEGGSFETLDISGFTLPATVSEVYSASNGGCVVKLTTTGYSSGMVVMCGVADGVVVGSKLVSSAETPAIGGSAAETYAGMVVGKDAENIDTIDTISGATKTTAAYRAAVKDALNTAIIVGGGNVDIRSEEEILLDNLSQALASAEGSFEKYFFTEDIAGFDAIYLADNGTGAVFVKGESFIAIDGDNNVVTECTDEEKASVASAYETIKATATEDIDIAAYAEKGLSKYVVSAKRTQTGNYILDVNAAGYGRKGGDEYHTASGKYIEIRVSVTPDGRILDCLTLFQAESKNVGDVCADESFYGQFVGKTIETYENIDVISGATITTDGYKKGILDALNAVKIFEEVQ